jgi:hypothetical protein
MREGSGITSAPSRIAQNEKPPLVIIHIDAAARVDGDLLASIDPGDVVAGLLGEVGDRSVSMK